MKGLASAGFLNTKENRVRTLLDVRHNPFSMNPHFSRKKLETYLQELGIRYEHLKEYGIPTEIRKAGNAMQWYEQNVRSKIQASIFGAF
jgi:uncharacterized protein (DUF488 family)